MKYDTKKIVAVIQDAIKSADAADPGPGLENDGGSCNFDAAYRLFVKHNIQFN